MKFALMLNLDRLDPGVPLTTVWDRIQELVVLADRGGFEIIWTGEHHTIELTIAPNPFQLLSNWARLAERARLGTGVVQAPYWHPIKLAGEAAMCDLLTGGRLELGVGRGSYQYEFDRMKPGTQQKEGTQYMKELIPAVRGLWKGNHAHEGKYWHYPATTSVPRPLQDSVPMWCAARDPASFDWAIQNDMNIMATPLQAPHAEVESLVARFETALANNPGKPRPRLTMMRRTCVYESPEQADRPIGALINYGRYFENLLKNIGSIDMGFPDPVDVGVIANRSDYDPKALRTNMMFGTPDEVIQKLRAYQRLGIDSFLYGALFGLEYPMVKRSLQLFISDVMPAFR